MKKTGTSRHSAFTLIEILVVLAIIGILSAILFPRFRAPKRPLARRVVLQPAASRSRRPAVFSRHPTLPRFATRLLPTAAEYDGTVSTDARGQLHHLLRRLRPLCVARVTSRAARICCCAQRRAQRPAQIVLWRWANRRHRLMPPTPGRCPQLRMRVAMFSIIGVTAPMVSS